LVSNIFIHPYFTPLQKGEHYHIDDGYDAMNNVYACGLLEDINIEPEQDMTDPSKINVKIKVDEIEPRSMEVSVFLIQPPLFFCDYE